MHETPRRELWWHQLLILITAGLVFFTNLGAAALFDEDEPKNAVCGREMYLRGDWIVPTFNAELRTDKPILIYWIMLCSYSVLGVSEFAARFGSSVLAMGTSLLTYHIGRRLFHPQVGLYAAVILCTCLMFSAVGRAVTPDSTLIFCTTLAFFCYVWSVTTRYGGNFGEPELESGRRRTWDEYSALNVWSALPMYIAMGFAVLAKGPIGFLLPCSIIGLNLLVRRELDEQIGKPKAESDKPGQEVPGLPPSAFRLPPFSSGFLLSAFRFPLRFFHPVRFGGALLAMRAFWGLPIVAAIALPWYIAVGQATEGAWLAGFLGDHNVGRFLEPKENHSGPVFYYLIVIFLGTFPWSVFLPLAIWNLVQRLKQGAQWSPGLVFVSGWAGFWIAFFSLASTKLPNYILPSYPAVALLIAVFLYEWQHQLAAISLQAFQRSCTALVVAGAAFLIAVPIAMAILLPDLLGLAMIGFIPLMGGIIAYRAVSQNQRQHAVWVVALTAVCLAVSVVGIAPGYVAPYQDGPQFGRRAKAMANGETPQLATFDYFAPTLVFYAETPVQKLQLADDIPAFFGAHPEGLLLTREDRLDELKALLPADITVLGQQRRFLRRHDLVLLGRQAKTQAVQPVSHSSSR